ncbi:protein kinase domain-containing protein [Melittangium boletus]|uniref:serine/threonine-protein kinase n=1 Tax=Melittangium boletus TaxID=83453 RepID=UPI003DA2CE56
MTLQAGRVIGGRFRVLRPLGAGGMGAVYEAEQQGLGRLVALKIMHPHVAQAPGFTERFHREAQVLARLHHPGSVEVYDYGLDAGFLYLAMERVTGETLEAVLQREGALEPGRAVDIAAAVLDVLEAAHALGIVHRDLKPANLFLERPPEGERVKVLDFGLAMLAQPGQGRLTQEGLTVGTPGFMSPEQLRGLPVDARSDLYSLGCVLYESLTGLMPFPVMPSAELAAAHLYRPVTPLNEARPDLALPERLSALVMKALEKLPGARPADAAAMRAELLAAREAAGAQRVSGRRGEGKKHERLTSPLQAAVKPAPGDVSVGVVASRAGGGPLLEALATCGFRARSVSAEEAWTGLDAVLVLAEGRETLERARQWARRPGTPPVLLCGPAEDWDLVTGALEGGLFDFVPLPPDPIDLSRKVARARKSKR